MHQTVCLPIKYFRTVPSESLNHGMFKKNLLQIVRYQWTEKSVANKNIETYKKMHWCSSIGSNERSILDESFKWIKRKLNHFQILFYDQQIKWNLQKRNSCIMHYSVIANKMHQYFYLQWTEIMCAPLLHVLFSEMDLNLLWADLIADHLFVGRAYCHSTLCEIIFDTDVLFS